MTTATAAAIAPSPPAMIQIAARKPNAASSAAPRKKPTPFTAFFDPVSTATQRKSPPSALGAKSFTALFDDILARSLATPETPCVTIT